jgi:uncharacterized protein YkwD
VIAAIDAGVATDGDGNASLASTSTDNTVTFAPPPSVTINQAASQADPASDATILFDVVFSEAVSDFATGDVALSGTAGATTATVSGSGTTYTVSVTGMTRSGTVVAAIAAGAATDADGNASLASTSTDNTVTFAPPLDDFEQEVLRLTNEFREENGLAPLANDSRLNAAAEDWSQTMAVDDSFVHSALPEQIEEFGYEPAAWAENIAGGYPTPESVVNGWINSEGHRANMLSEDVTDIGVGYHLLEDDTGEVVLHHYWTQIFGTESGDALL